MGEILPFKKPQADPEYLDVLQCPCGNQSFICAEDGRVICASCLTVNDIAAVTFNLEDLDDAT
jgi:hypothetical protein